MTNSKLTKRALLSSVMALILCFTMLLGTTFAWFTDTASTSVNKIEAGTLDVQLLDSNDNSLEGKTLSWQKAADHEDEDVLWEPGCTYSLQPITIKNNGSLALKYKIVITGIDGDAELNEVIDWTLEVKDSEDNAITSELTADHSLAVGESNTLTISGHMKENAGNGYQGLSIDGISITVYATQDTVEYDSISDQYDKNARYDDVSIWNGETTTEITKNTEDGKYHISTAAELVWLMDNTQDSNSAYIGETIVLDKDIDLDGKTVKGFGSEVCNFAGSFDGQEHTISNFVIERSDKDTYAGLFNYVTHGTISNLTVENATINGGQSQVGALVGGLNDNATVKDCSVVNCTVVANRKVGGAVGYVCGATVENVSVKDTIINVETNDSAQYGKVVGFENTGAVVNNVSDENVTIVFMKSVDSFSDLDAAIKDSNVSKIVLSDDVANTKTTLQNEFCYTLSAGRNLTVDLGGNTLNTTVKLFKVESGATLTLTSSAAGGKIYCNSNLGGNRFIVLVDDGGTLNIENNVTIEAKKFGEFGEDNPIAGVIYSEGTVNMKGGEIIVHDSIAVTLWASAGGAKFNMTGGKITIAADDADFASVAVGVTDTGFNQNASYSVSLTNGEISGKGWAVMDAFGGDVTYNKANGFVIDVTAVDLGSLS